MALRTWQNVVGHIPSMMTGLGVLGTFIGLMVGVRRIGFSSISAALISVQELTQGIETAFHTSIAGIIFSIIFNALYQVTWNTTMRALGLFVEEFHQNVIPSVEEQDRYMQKKDTRTIISLLERLPKNPGYSVAAGNTPSVNTGNEQILMPQIRSGLANREFNFVLQPKYDINTKQVVSAEALVRWNHPKLGPITPSVFIPIIEQNGFITRLDEQIWDDVCMTIRKWIDEGKRPFPISVNITKTDILAMDVAECFENLLKKHEIPPRYLELEIAQNAYYDATDEVLACEKRLREMGIKVTLDGFNGNFITLSMLGNIQADEMKLDLRHLAGEEKDVIASTYAKARELHIDVSAEGIENMNQITMLKKQGCTKGQGYLLSKPITIDEFESLVQQN